MCTTSQKAIIFKNVITANEPHTFQFYKHIRTWFFLPYAEEHPHATKLVFDFFLMLFASRQLRVFRVEKTQGDAYAGGSNSEDIGQDWETPSFVNPVPDFLGVVG